MMSSRIRVRGLTPPPSPWTDVGGNLQVIVEDALRDYITYLGTVAR